MKDRRQILTGGAGMLSELALGTAPAAEAAADCDRPARGPHADYFPNRVLVTHEGRKALFYDDLLAGKTVLVHCMSVLREPDHPVVANVSRAYRIARRTLGARLGRDVFFYSMTVDPGHDTPAVLADFAAEHGAGPGWLFLTGEADDLDLLRGRLYVNPVAHAHAHHHGGPVEDCSMGLARYGNEAAGVWGAVPLVADPEWIARRLEWVQPRERLAGAPGRPRRGGPFPPGEGRRA